MNKRVRFNVQSIMRKLKFLIQLMIFFAITFSMWGQQNEYIGLIKKEQVNQREVLIFITDNQQRFEITGKLTSFIDGFYKDQKLKVEGKIKEYSADEKKAKQLDGEIEIKEIIVTIQ